MSEETPILRADALDDDLQLDDEFLSRKCDRLMSQVSREFAEKTAEFIEKNAKLLERLADNNDI